MERNAFTKKPLAARASHVGRGRCSNLVLRVAERGFVLCVVLCVVDGGSCCSRAGKEKYFRARSVTGSNFELPAVHPFLSYFVHICFDNSTQCPSPHRTSRQLSSRGAAQRTAHDTDSTSYMNKENKNNISIHLFATGECER